MIAKKIFYIFGFVILVLFLDLCNKHKNDLNIISFIKNKLICFPHQDFFDISVDFSYVVVLRNVEKSSNMGKKLAEICF